MADENDKTPQLDSDLEAEQITAGFAGRFNNFGGTHKASTPPDFNSDQQHATDNDLKFEMELLRSKWTGLAKEVEVLEEAMGDLANQLKVAHERQLRSSELIEQRDKEIESLRAKLEDQVQDNENPGSLALLVPRDGSAANAHPIGAGLITLGSGTDNDICIRSEFVSRHHGQIVSTGSEAVLSDLNSTNGTYVNLKRIKRHALRDGDAITVGKHQFRYVKSSIETSERLVNIGNVPSRITDPHAGNLLQEAPKNRN